MVLKLLTRRIAALTWVLIFGGIVMLGLGSVLYRTEPSLGGVILTAAVIAIVVGVVLVWVRSRIGEDGPT